MDELVARNTSEFRSEVDALFEVARGELAEEVREVVRMAYDKRRQLHLQALAEGRVQAPAPDPPPPPASGGLGKRVQEGGRPAGRARDAAGAGEPG